mgnify:CR=1 FL=1
MLKSKFIRKPARQLKYFGFKRLIFSAGMPRSGSTLLFNIVRFILEEEHQDDLSTAWINDLKTMPKGQAYLIKTHACDIFDRIRADKIFYSYRDIRDVMVSRWRKFGREPDMEIARYYIRQYEFARKHADLVLKYEDFMNDIPGTIDKVAEVLGQTITREQILAKLPDKEQAPKSKGDGRSDNMLHEGHATGTMHDEWREVLPLQFQTQLLHEYEWWFKENKYSL